MAHIALTRGSHWSDRGRSYRVFVDGQLRGKIDAGATMLLEVSPGRHTIRTKIDWCRTPELEFDVPDDPAAAPRAFFVSTNLPEIFLCAFPIAMLWVFFMPWKYLTLEPLKLKAA